MSATSQSTGTVPTSLLRQEPSVSAQGGCKALSTQQQKPWPPGASCLKADPRAGTGLVETSWFCQDTSGGFRTLTRDARDAQGCPQHPAEGSGDGCGEGTPRTRGTPRNPLHHSQTICNKTLLMPSLLLLLNLISFSLLRCPFVHSNIAAVKISIDSSFFQVGAVIYEPLRK